MRIKMVNALILCSIDDKCVKAYPEWTLKTRNCHDNILNTTCDGIKVVFDVDALLDLGIIWNDYTKQRLLESLTCPGIPINSISRRAIEKIQCTDPERLKRWQCSECFDPNYVTFDAHGKVVYAKGCNIDIIMDCCIKITPTMWCALCQEDKIYAYNHPNFNAVTSEWSSLFKMEAIGTI